LCDINPARFSGFSERSLVVLSSIAIIFSIPFSVYDGSFICVADAESNNGICNLAAGENHCNSVDCPSSDCISGVEIDDGLDNDCDGWIDENFVDSDGDGVNDHDELLAGTRPRDANHF